MKDILLKIACVITGYSYWVVRGYDPWTKRKISIFAIAILFPTTIGLLNGYLLTTKVLGESHFHGLIVAGVIGTVIFFIERVIVMSKGSWPIGVLRLLLACVIATIGSFALKEVVFHKDIEKALAARRLQNADSLKAMIWKLHARELSDMDSLIKRYQFQYEDLIQRANKEAVGGFTGKRGVDAITRFYASQAEKVKSTSLDPIIAKKDLLTKQIDQEVEKTQKEDTETDGLLTRLTIFFSIMMKDSASRIVFWIFFLLFFLIEMMVFVLKMCLQKSLLEFDEKEYYDQQLSKASKYKSIHYANN